jgi:hypothetical protein
MAMAPLKLFVPVAALLLASASHAGLVGKRFDASYRYPDVSTTYPYATASPSTFTVGSGVETIFDVERVTQISVDFSDSALTLVLTTSLTGPTWNSASFNGPVFDLVAGGPLDIVSAAVDSSTTMAGFDASRVSFNAGRIGIDWNGLSYGDGTKVVVNFTSAIPEPSSWALAALAGFALLGVRRSARCRAERQPPSAAG